MAEKQGVSDLYKKNAEKAADTQTLHEGCLTNVEFE